MFFNGLLGAIAAQGQSIVAKAILWLNPTVPSIGTTDPISPWIDVGLAPAENATNATPANRPALIADIANGFPGAQYDGVNDTLNAPLVLPLPWTMAIAIKIPTKPGSKKYILGKAGTGGIYIAPVTGYVGVDLGGVGIEGTVDRTGSFIPANMISVHAVAEEVIVSIPVSDFFTAIPDSLVIGDTYWDSRWTKTINTTNDVASESITGNDLVITVNPQLSSENQAVFYTINQSSDHSGDFYFEMPLTVANVDNPGGPAVYLWLTVGGIFHFIGYTQGSNGNGWFWRVGGTTTVFDSSLNGTKTLIIQRVGSTVTFKDGTTILGTNTNSGDVSIIRFIAANNGGGPQITQDVTFTYGYLKALDGVGGNPIEIVETSQEATLYVNGVEEATGAIGAGTLPSIDVIEAGLAADVPEVQIYDEALSSEEITQIASELSIYQ
jgi:hypothetical protein